jgi:ketosteroid isomerase-like protein
MRSIFKPEHHMTSSNTSILDEIAALEDARYTAMLKGDVATLERLLHPVLVYMHSSGVADSKASYISGLRDGVWNYQHIERADQKTVVQGNTALVFNRLLIRIKVRGVHKELDNRAVAVWVRDSNEWRLLGLQSGPTVVASA